MNGTKSQSSRWSVTGRLPSIAILARDRPLLGESGHRNFDAKPRTYKFASGCLGSKAGVRINRPSSRGLEPVLRLEVGLRGDLLVTRPKYRR